MSLATLPHRSTANTVYLITIKKAANTQVYLIESRMYLDLGETSITVKIKGGVINEVVDPCEIDITAEIKEKDGEPCDSPT